MKLANRKRVEELEKACNSVKGSPLTLWSYTTPKYQIKLMSSK